MPHVFWQKLIKVLCQQLIHTENLRSTKVVMELAILEPVGKVSRQFLADWSFFLTFFGTCCNAFTVVAKTKF